MITSYHQIFDHIPAFDAQGVRYCPDAEMQGVVMLFNLRQWLSREFKTKWHDELELHDTIRHRLNATLAASHEKRRDMYRWLCIYHEFVFGNPLFLKQTDIGIFEDDALTLAKHAIQIVKDEIKRKELYDEESFTLVAFVMKLRLLGFIQQTDEEKFDGYFNYLVGKWCDSYIPGKGWKDCRTTQATIRRVIALGSSTDFITMRNGSRIMDNPPDLNITRSEFEALTPLKLDLYYKALEYSNSYLFGYSLGDGILFNPKTQSLFEKVHPHDTLNSEAHRLTLLAHLAHTDQQIADSIVYKGIVPPGLAPHSKGLKEVVDSFSDFLAFKSFIDQLADRKSSVSAPTSSVLQTTKQNTVSSNHPDQKSEEPKQKWVDPKQKSSKPKTKSFKKKKR